MALSKGIVPESADFLQKKVDISKIGLGTKSNVFWNCICVYLRDKF